MTEPMGERGRQGAAPLGAHTPGPWTAIPGPFSDGDWWVVGPAWFYPTPEDCVLEEADARLIAAAPDLLEALENAVGDHVGTADDCEDDCWSHAARATIAKARGEQ